MRKPSEYHVGMLSACSIPELKYVVVCSQNADSTRYRFARYAGRWMYATPPGKWGATVSPSKVNGKACVEKVVVVAIAHFMHGARVEILMAMISCRVGRESVDGVSPL